MEFLFSMPHSHFEDGWHIENDYHGYSKLQPLLLRTSPNPAVHTDAAR